MIDEDVIMGRGWNFGLLLLLFIVPGLFVVIIGIIDGYWNVITFGLLMIFAFLPFGIYALLPKRMVFNKFGVSYWIGRKKKFELQWTDIVKLSTYNDYQSFIVIHTKNKIYHLETVVIFSRNKRIQAFKKLVKGTQNNECIEIEDTLGWLYE